MLSTVSRWLTYLNAVLYAVFDFAAKPGGVAYFAAYLAVAIVLLFEFRKSGTGPGRVA